MLDVCDTLYGVKKQCTTIVNMPRHVESTTKGSDVVFLLRQLANTVFSPRPS